MTVPPLPRNTNNLPIYTIVLTVLMIALAVAALVFIPERNHAETDLLLAMIVGSVPGLIAAGFSERNHRDIRNGVVENKAKAGAMAALVESGVQETVDSAGRGAASTVAIQALAELLKNNTSIHMETHEAPTPPPTPTNPPSPLA